MTEGSDVVAANIRKSLTGLKVGSKWLGRGSHHNLVTVEKLEGASVFYRRANGKLDNMTADYFVYWYILKD